MLDLASFIAGPLATAVMGDHGAEAIKIEPPGRGHAAELATILAPIFAAHPWPEWRKRLSHHEIAFGLLGSRRRRLTGVPSMKAL